MIRNRVIHPGTGQVLIWGTEEECMKFLEKEAKRLKGDLLKTSDGEKEVWFDIRNRPYLYQKEQEVEQGVVSNNMFNIAWASILAIALLPIVAPVVYMSTMIMTKEGEPYYEKYGIDRKNAMFVIGPCFQETLKEVKPTPENRELFYEVSCKKLQEAYEDLGLVVDFDKFRQTGDSYQCTYKEFFNAYYDLIIQTCGDKLVEKYEEANK